MQLNNDLDEFFQVSLLKLSPTNHAYLELKMIKIITCSTFLMGASAYN